MTTHKRILSPLGKGPTRRSLFGPVDREQLQAEYRAALQKDLEEACQRWGFDFISNKPLENSNFRWESIPGTNVPPLYRSSMKEHTGGLKTAEAAVRPKGRASVRLPQNDKENIPCSPKKRAISQENLEKTPVRRENKGLKRKQTNITDFYQAKRRVVGMPLKSDQ